MLEQVRVGGRASASISVVGHFKGQKPPKDSPASGLASRSEATGEVGAIASHVEGNSRVVLIGLGEKSSFGPATCRTVGASLARHLDAVGGGVAEIDLDHAAKATRADLGALGSAMGESFGILTWEPKMYAGSATPPKTLTRVTLRSSKAFEKGLERGLGIADGVNTARTLSQTPPNIATPAYIASEARRLARKTGMKCTVIKGPALEKEGLTGHMEVGRASTNAPCLVRLEYSPARATKRPLVLVGKTITYDSGGLSLKINNSMKGMKRDKDGGCGVLGAMHAIATTIKPNRRVVALLACAENSVAGDAYRPDDVITFRNGVTVEVTNTDAEGRLVLADALCWACEKEDPECILDFATLTGGVVVALGPVYAGMWCQDDDLRQKVTEAGERSGEEVWHMPLNDKYRDMMRSSVADLHNSAPVRAAHPVQGAAFLSFFVEKDIPWAHIDIAGVHSVDGESGPFCAGPTGFGVRLVSEFV